MTVEYSGGSDTNPRYFCAPEEGTPTVLVRLYDSAFAERLLPSESGWESCPDLIRLTHGAPTMEWRELRPSEAPGVAAAMGRAGATSWARVPI